MFTVSTTEKGLGDNDGHIATVTMDINTGCWGLIEQKKQHCNSPFYPIQTGVELLGPPL